MKRIIILGLTALCALALAAITASGAVAAETTAWTCVTGGTGGQGHKFTEADCKTQNDTTGTFGHVNIPAAKTTVVASRLVANPILKTTIAGAAITLEATGVECVGCTIANSEPVAGEMKTTGSGRLKFTGVEVEKPAEKCLVESLSGTSVVLTEPLLFETTGTNEVLIKPAVGTLLAEFAIVKQAGVVCGPAGVVQVRGDANGTTSGALLTVNVAVATKTLTVGVNGASLTSEATVEAGEAGHPTALT